MMMREGEYNSKMKILIAVAAYPDNHGSVKLMYTHVRSKYYIEQELDIEVLNFSATKDYVVDSVNVITLETFKNRILEDVDHYNLLVCHAPNLRNHYRFLKKYQQAFENIVFFFHGHEILRLNETYPKPYKFVQKSKMKRLLRGLYDDFKLILWKRFFEQLIHKSHFVFVSKWLYSKFLKNVKVEERVIREKVHIINNSVGEIFEKMSYDYTEPKPFDFITIRSDLDGSKYGVDIVNELALNNPSFNFLLIGRGSYFNYNERPTNLTLKSERLTHKEMIEFLNMSKCGLLPTRQDTQGVMTCEFLTFGLPTITSDIDVCHEILDGFENAKMICNNHTDINLRPIFDELTAGVPYKKNETYFAKNTINREVELFKWIFKR